VSGAGGSIGSELCRQLLEGGAERLFLFGHGENSIYEIERELRLLQEEGVGEKATIVPIIGEMQDRDYLHFILSRTRAGVVFHAAAHKHVPLMEANPVEAVKNNVFGTKNIVDASKKSGVERFVLISTDKAVDPRSVYGASKLLAEEIVLREGKNGHHFLVVRFGNVLGSRGSILPLFRRQILKGGPVTVTHPETRRYFMTIPEASSLVLKAGGVGTGGEVYLLDMGESVSIRELAEQMIRFYSFEPGIDIPIEYTGLRRGEKLLEKLHADSETPEPTEHPKILKLRRKTLINGRITSVLERLRPICFHDPEYPHQFRNRRALRAVLEEVIPGIGPAGEEPEF
jgi:FlaA1/EpsC-like NDP-sugar epimerase